MPTKIEVTYTTDYNIIALDVVVQAIIIKHCESMIAQLEQELLSLELRIDNSTAVIEMRELDVARGRLVERLASLKSSSILHKYNLAVAPLLTTYRDTPLGDRVIDAMNMTCDRQSREEIIREKTVDAYVQVVTSLNLPNVNITKEKPESKSKVKMCETCNAPLIACPVLLSGLLVCSVCGTHNKPKTSGSGAKEYDSLGNLMKAHKRYVGTIVPKCDMDLVTSKLDEYAASQGKYGSEYYRALPLNSNGKKDGTSVDDLCYALKMVGENELYKSYNYVGHHYYGWALPDLRHLEADMITNFRAKQEVWDNDMTDEEKGCDSNLCIEYRLCREHQHAGRDCELEDYKIPRKSKTLDRYNNGYAIMCKRAGFGNIFSMD
ncbi:Divergent Poxvirus Late Transcription Factor VLTF3 like [uncultured virus]|nr:Divergent Poxvirus Late Transcription Factor VLTF3 like [uncultured virus]